MKAEGGRTWGAPEGLQIWGRDDGHFKCLRLLQTVREKFTVGEIFMQNRGTRFHSSQSQPGALQHERGFSSPFHEREAEFRWIPPIKISAHVISAELCRAALRRLHDRQREAAAPAALPTLAPCVPAHPGSTRGALHSSAPRCEGMEHTQSYVFLPLGASGIGPPSSPFSEQTSQMGRPTADLKTQVCQTRFCHQLKWPNWFRAPESSNWGAVLEAEPELYVVSGSSFTLQPSSKCSDTQSQGFDSSNLPHTTLRM